jgi:hypothetical protein
MKEKPDSSNPEIAKITSKVWNGLSDEEKKPYTQIYENEKATFDKLMLKFNKKYPKFSLIPKK